LGGQTSVKGGEGRAKKLHSEIKNSARQGRGEGTGEHLLWRGFSRGKTKRNLEGFSMHFMVKRARKEGGPRQFVELALERGAEIVQLPSWRNSDWKVNKKKIPDGAK